jgi:hypothetical protein
MYITFSLTVRYGDIKTAWAPRASKGHHEFLELQYPHMMIIRKIDIYETYNPGAVVKISVQRNNEWVVIYEGKPLQQSIPQQSRIFSPELKPVDFMTNIVRIDMDTRTSYSWSEIDAVQISGISYTAAGPNEDREKIDKTFTRDMNNIYSQCKQNTGDGKIICGAVGSSEKKEYSVHLSLLKHRCPKLYQVVKKAENSCFIDTDHLSDVLDVILEYIYTDQVVIPLVSPDTETLDLHDSDERFIKSLQNAATVFELPIISEFCTKLESYLEFITWREYCPLIADTLPTTMRQDMKALSDDQETADVILQHAQDTIQAHSFILKNRSAFFNALLTRWIEEKSKPITIDDISLPTLRCLLEYIYTGQTIVDESNAIELMVAANQYLLDDFTEPVQRIVNSISDENYLELIKIGYGYENSEIMDKCVVLLEKKIGELDKVPNLRASLAEMEEDVREAIFAKSDFVKEMYHAQRVEDEMFIIRNNSMKIKPPKVEEESPNLTLLLEMGYQYDQVKYALARTESLEAAVEFLLNDSVDFC